MKFSSLSSFARGYHSGLFTCSICINFVRVCVFIGGRGGGGGGGGVLGMWGLVGGCGVVVCRMWFAVEFLANPVVKFKFSGGILMKQWKNCV